MTRLILHIGASKTGTTTLQQCLLNSYDMLLERGVLYPKPVHGNKHCELTPYLLSAEEAPNWLRTTSMNDATRIKRKGRQAWNNLLQQIAEHKTDTIILSSEHLFNFANSPNFGHALRQFQSIADDITIVAYVRAPSGRYLSSRQEGLKAGRRGAPPRSYSASHRPLHSLVDRDDLRLEVHNAERAVLIGNDIVTDFASRHLPCGVIDDLDRPERDLNTSISAEAMLIIETILDGNAPNQYRHIRSIHAALMKHIILEDRALAGKCPPKYKPGIARIIHDAAPDLEWLEKTFGIAFDRPASDISTKNILLRDLVSVTDLCEVDEQRLDQLWQAIATYTEPWGDRLQRLLKDTKRHRNSVSINRRDIKFIMLDLGLMPIRFALRLGRGLKRIGLSIKRHIFSQGWP